MVVGLVLVDSGTVVLVGLAVVLFCDSVVGTVKEALTVKSNICISNKPSARVCKCKISVCQSETFEY